MRVWRRSKSRFELHYCSLSLAPMLTPVTWPLTFDLWPRSCSSLFHLWQASWPASHRKPSPIVSEQEEKVMRLNHHYVGAQFPESHRRSRHQCFLLSFVYAECTLPFKGLKKLILWFRKDVLNWSKVTIKTFIIL